MINNNTNNQIFVHFICLGLMFSFSGILLSLKLVTTPPKIINIGNTQGVLKNRYVLNNPTIIMIYVMVLLMEILYILNAANAIKPTAIGCT